MGSEIEYSLKIGLSQQTVWQLREMKTNDDIYDNNVFIVWGMNKQDNSKRIYNIAFWLGARSNGFYSYYFT